MLLTDVVIGKGMQLTHGLEAMKNWESQELSLSGSTFWLDQHFDC